VVSGVAFDVTVIVEDAFDNTVTTYQGTIQFATSDTDPGVVLPSAYTFTSDDAGVHTFAGGVTLITVGSQTITVEDPSLGIAGTALVEVTSPAAPPGGRAKRCLWRPAGARDRNSGTPRLPAPPACGSDSDDFGLPVEFIRGSFIRKGTGH
jgi:hypothetical protein